MNITPVARLFRQALSFLLVMTFLTVAYTGVVTLGGHVCFPRQASGSLFEAGGKTYSALLGQPFAAPNHLWGRPCSADTTSFSRSGQPLFYAGPGNMSPAVPAFGKAVAQRVRYLREAHPEQGDAPIPVDLVTASASGLDPHISPAAAEYQVARLARTTGFTPEEVRRTVRMYTEGRAFGIFGEPRVHVLKVNLALDGLLPNARTVQGAMPAIPRTSRS